MKALTQVKIEGLFLDYDGTISPINVPREQSGVLPQIESALNQIRQLVPVGVITTKDLAFILPKTPFAHAWATVAGLEMKIGENIVKAPGLAPSLTHLTLALRYAKQHLGDDNSRASAGAKTRSGEGLPHQCSPLYSGCSRSTGIRFTIQR